MRFPGYWVSPTDSGVHIERAIFDETELDPATDWKQAWQNAAPEATSWGFVDWAAAAEHAQRLLNVQPSKT